METKSITVQVVPDAGRVKLGVMIDGVKFKYAFDGYQRILFNDSVTKDEREMVLSAFNEVFEVGGDFLVKLDNENIKDKVMIVSHCDSYYFNSLEEIFDEYLPEVNVRIWRSKYFSEIIPDREYVAGLDFVVDLMAYIHSGIVLYIEEGCDYVIPDRMWDSGRYGYIFANKRKFRNDKREFVDYVKGGLNMINQVLLGDFYNIRTKDDYGIALRSEIKEMEGDYMIIWCDGFIRYRE